jgi:hypothetical protein
MADSKTASDWIRNNLDPVHPLTIDFGKLAEAAAKAAVIGSTLGGLKVGEQMGESMWKHPELLKLLSANVIHIPNESDK